MLCLRLPPNSVTGIKTIFTYLGTRQRAHNTRINTAIGAHIEGVTKTGFGPPSSTRVTTCINEYPTAIATIVSRSSVSPNKIGDSFASSDNMKNFDRKMGRRRCSRSGGAGRSGRVTQSNSVIPPTKLRRMFFPVDVSQLLIL